jgi:hypothetical protein
VLWHFLLRASGPRAKARGDVMFTAGCPGACCERIIIAKTLAVMHRCFQAHACTVQTVCVQDLVLAVSRQQRA